MPTKKQKDKFKKDIKRWVFAWIGVFAFFFILGLILGLTGAWMIGVWFYAPAGAILSILALIIFLKIVFYFVEAL